MKIIIYGDYTSVLWHPLAGIAPWVDSLRAAGHEVTMTEDYPAVSAEVLQQYEVCVNYTDNWEHRGTQEAEQVLCDFVEAGGKLLSIHSGIITPGAEQLLDLHGASFNHHPEAEEITFYPGEAEGELAALLDGFATFAIKEEPYMFDIRKDDRAVYLWYEYHGDRYPAAWVRKQGAGTMVYIAPGHEARVTGAEMVQKLYSNALIYLQNC